MSRPLSYLLLLLSACTPPASSTLRPQRADPGAASQRVAPRAEVHGLRNIQRTLQRLERSTAEAPERVRILFYGQSITQSAWSRKLASVLAQRYPHARLELHNRALGGFASELLVKTAESDLYPEAPDLVIFHVYGAHDRYEDIVRRLRERTTAEVLLQTDHVTTVGDLNEETDARKLAPRSESWSAFMNHAFLPGLVDAYQVALCDQRSAWKQYLQTQRLAPSALLLDVVHPNTQGDALMAALVESCLVRAPELDPSPAESWQTSLPESALEQTSGRSWRTTFEGNRLEAAVAASNPAEALEVLIDGRPPSTFPGAYSFARAHAEGADKWPPIHDLSYALAPGQTRLVETFTLSVRRVSADSQVPAHYAFDVVSDKAGPEGSGRSDQHFVSRSGRLVVDPEDWNVAYAFELAGVKPPPDRFDVTLRVEPHFTDTIAPRATSHAEGQRVVTLAAGLPNTKHELTLTSRSPRAAPGVALRVHRPPLGRH